MSRLLYKGKGFQVGDQVLITWSQNSKLYGEIAEILWGFTHEGPHVLLRGSPNCPVHPKRLEQRFQLAFVRQGKEGKVRIKGGRAIYDGCRKTKGRRACLYRGKVRRYVPHGTMLEMV